MLKRYFHRMEDEWGLGGPGDVFSVVFLVLIGVPAVVTVEVLAFMLVVCVAVGLFPDLAPYIMKR